MGTVIKISAARKFKRELHPKVGTYARVRLPRWIFTFPWFVSNPNAGRLGQIVCVEEGQYSKKLIYTLIFEKAGELYPIYCYFEEDLEFLEPPETK